MLRWRLLLGTLIIAALLGLCWLDHLAPAHGLFAGMYLLPLGIVLVVLGSQEIIQMLETGGMKPCKSLVYVGNILLFASSWFPTAWAAFGPNIPENSSSILSNPFAWTAAIFAVCVFAAFLSAIRRYEKPGGNLANVAATVFALAYLGLMFFFIAQLRLTWGIGALASMIIVVKMGDTGAYTVGRLIGRHKMSPRVSPGKTLEGAAGAIIFACIGAWLSFHLLGSTIMLTGDRSASDFGGWWIYGILVGLAGLFGDLSESLMKRDVGVKDSSTWMPGFGGILDILDSLLLAAPIAWICWSIAFPSGK
jgi:phosphatidate cytidylyltransferase